MKSRRQGSGFTAPPRSGVSVGCHPVAAGGPSLSGRSSPKRGRGLRGQEAGEGGRERCLLRERGPGDRLRSCPSPGGHTAWQKPVISSQAFAPAGRGTTDSTRPSRSQAARRRSGLCFRTQAPPSTWPSGAPQALRSHTHRRQQRRGARSPRAAVHTCWPRKARTAPGVGAEGGRRCMRTRRPHLQPLVSQATV